jgi:hypothetical protein
VIDLETGLLIIQHAVPALMFWSLLDIIELIVERKM